MTLLILIAKQEPFLITYFIYKFVFKTVLLKITIVILDFTKNDVPSILFSKVKQTFFY
jgi:hypothetical protein